MKRFSLLPCTLHGGYISRYYSYLWTVTTPMTLSAWGGCSGVLLEEGWGWKWEIMKKCATSCGCSSNIIFREWERQAWKKNIAFRMVQKSVWIAFFRKKNIHKKKCTTQFNCGDHMQLQYARKSSHSLRSMCIWSQLILWLYRFFTI